jgi:hypothetical protein
MAVSDLSKLQAVGDYLKPSGMFLDVCRWFGYEVTMLETSLNDMVNKAVTKSLDYMNLWKKLGGTGDKYHYIKYINAYGKWVLLISILVIGFMLMRGQGHDVSSAPFNIMSGLVLLMVLPMLMTTVATPIKETQKALGAANGSPAASMVKNLLTDNYVLANKGWDTSKVKGSAGNTINAKDLKYVDINEKITDTGKLKDSKFLDNRIGIGTDKKGNPKLAAIEYDHGNSMINSMTGNLFGSYYYRYSFHPWVAMILVLLLILAGGLTIVRFGHVFYSLATDWIWAHVVLFIKVHNLNNFKQVVMGIAGSFMTILVLLYSYYFYGTAASIVGAEPNLIARVLLLVGLTWGLLDAPMIVQKTLGVDAGLRSAGAAALGSIFAARTAVGAATGAAKALGGAALGVAEGGTFGAGFLKGLGGDSISSLSDQVKGGDDKKKPDDDGGGLLDKAEQGQGDDKPDDQGEGTGKDPNAPDSEKSEGQDDQGDGTEPDDSPAQDAADEAATDDDPNAGEVDPDAESLEDSMPPEDPDADASDGLDPAVDDQGGDQAAPDTDPTSDSPAGEDKDAAQETSKDVDQADKPTADAKPETEGDPISQRNAGKQQQRDAGESLGDKSDGLQAEPDPVTKNPITAAAREYLETPKMERHSGSALGRIENAFHSGERIGSDFDSYSSYSRGQQKSYKEHKDMVSDMKAFQKEMDKDDEQ